MSERPNTVLRVALIGVLVIAGLAGGDGTAARFSDSERETVAVEAAVPTTEMAREPKPRPAISFAAVCYAPGSEVTRVGIKATEFEHNEPTEPVAVRWRATGAVSSVVLKSGRYIERFEGGTQGTAVVGGGTPAAGSPARPCPAGERLLVKFEWDGGSFVPETER